MWAFLPPLQPCWAPAPTQAPQPRGEAREQPGWAGWHALHQSPGRAISPTQTGASGAGRPPLQGRVPIPSAWAHLSLLCPSPHPPKGFLCWGLHGGRGEGDTIRIWGCFLPSKAPRAPCLGCPADTPTQPLCHLDPSRAAPSGSPHQAQASGLCWQTIPQMPGPRRPEDHQFRTSSGSRTPTHTTFTTAQPPGQEQERGCSRVTPSDPGGIRQVCSGTHPRLAYPVCHISTQSKWGLRPSPGPSSWAVSGSVHTLQVGKQTDPG